MAPAVKSTSNKTAPNLLQQSNPLPQKKTLKASAPEKLAESLPSRKTAMQLAGSLLAHRALTESVCGPRRHWLKAWLCGFRPRRHWLNAWLCGLWSSASLSRFLVLGVTG